MLGDNGSVIIGFIVFIIIMVSFAYIYKRITSQGRMGVRKSKYIEAVDRLHFTNDKWIEIVKIGDKVLLLGISQNRIDNLCKLEPDDLIENEQMMGYKFKDIMEKYISKKGKNINDTENEDK